MRELEKGLRPVGTGIYGGIKRSVLAGRRECKPVQKLYPLRQKRIRELYPDAEMPEIYYRPLPQELPAEYMARKEELRSAALRSYTRYISDENFCFIRNHVERIPETDALRGILDALLARADVLKDAVLSGDYVAMRRYADAGSLLASLKSGAERLGDWEPPEQEQLDLFTDYSLDGMQDEESMSMSM